MTGTAYPDSYLRDPIHVAEAVDRIHQALTDARHTAGIDQGSTAGSFGAVTQLACLYGVLASLAGQIGDEITARSDVPTPTAASLRTTDMFVTATQHTSDALVHLAQAIRHAHERETIAAPTPGDDRPRRLAELLARRQDDRRSRLCEHLAYRLTATTTELRHLTTALRRDHHQSGYTYPFPTKRVTGIEPVAGRIVDEEVGPTHEPPTRNAALHRSSTSTHALPTPSPAPAVQPEPATTMRNAPRGGR